MSKKNDGLLSLMLTDMASAPSDYRPTNFWQNAVDEVVAGIELKGVDNFRAQSGALSFFAPLYRQVGVHHRPEIGMNLLVILRGYGLKDPRLKLSLEQFLSGKLQAFSDYRVFKATVSDSHPYLDQVSESTVGNPVEQFVFDGKRYSRSMLNYLLGLNFIKQHCDLSEVNTVLEIGGGFGTLGEILLGDERNHCFYIDVDIPPTSYVATYYLQKVFGTDAIGTYNEFRDRESLEIAALREKYRGVILNSWQLPCLNGIVDLFVNFISFQEMEPDVVQNYLNHVDRLGARYILLRNLHEGKQKAQDENSLGVRNPIKGEDYDDFLPNYQLVISNTVPFGYKTVDGFHSELRIYQRTS